MKKYLGAWINAYCAIAILIIAVLGAALGISSVSSDAAGILLAVFLFSADVILGIFMYRERYSLFAFGDFQESQVVIKVPFCKKSVIAYEEIVSCGIAMYTHAYMDRRDSILSSDVFYFFISKDVFPRRYRTEINKWRLSASQIKVAFSKELYDYLMVNLPPKMQRMLQGDYWDFKSQFDKFKRF